MNERARNRYPIYVPSKGRWDNNLTAEFLEEDGLDYHLVVEAAEAERYRNKWGTHRVLALPGNDYGTSSFARNWIKDRSIEAGDVRHWQLDDNMRGAYRFWRGDRFHCHSGIALRVCEDFTDRYTNIGLSGLNYGMFGLTAVAPFRLNCHIYSCMLIANEYPFRFRLQYNEDTDYCLQVLSAGYCTVQIAAFLIRKEPTMIHKGGNTDTLYHGDGRLKMSRELERQWPHVVETRYRFGRPQHVVRFNWAKFDQPLKRRTDIEWPTGVDEYGMKLEARDEVTSQILLDRIQEHRESHE